MKRRKRAISKLFSADRELDGARGRKSYLLCSVSSSSDSPVESESVSVVSEVSVASLLDPSEDPDESVRFDVTFRFGLALCFGA